jgi:peptidoglycan/xylan/chitin deacetylase (PgdA/CDA1 family)
VLHRGDTDTRSLAFVIDVPAAPGNAGTVEDIVGALRDARVRASFAVTGRWAEANIELTRAIAADGHVIINTGYDGASFTGESSGQRALTFEARSLQLSRAETTIYRITNRSTRPFFRTPYGDSDASVEADAAALGYHVIVVGSIDVRGAVDAPAVRTRIANVAAGDVIVLSASAGSAVAEALPEVIDNLQSDGYDLITIQEMVNIEH